MTITASGAGAAFLAPQQQNDGSWALVLAALPDAEAFDITLTEAQTGYSNSPHPTTMAITYPALLGAPVFAIVAALDSRVVVLTRAMGAPPTWAAPFDPSDNAPYVLDLAQFLGSSAALDTVTRLTVSAAGVAQGVMIDGSDRRPVIDRVNKRIAIWLKVDSERQGAGYFVNPTPVLISATFTTVAADNAPAETYERSAFLSVRQL